MDFAIPAVISQDLDRIRDFIRTQLVPDLSSWTQKQKIDYISGSYQKSRRIIFLIYPGIFQQCLLWPLLKDCLKIYPYQPQGASSP